jgi:hypothetical protein
VLVAPQHDPTHVGAEGVQETPALTGLPGLDAINAPALPEVDAPLARFARVAISAALTPKHIDGDGVRRHEALYFETPAGPVPSVPLAAWLLTKGISPESLTGGESLVGNGAAKLLLGGDATWLPRYGAATKLDRSTAAAWLESSNNPADVRGKVVVVCPRSPTESVPAGRQLSRCDGTALRIASLLAGDYMQQPFWGKLLALALWCGVIAFAAFGCPVLPTGGRIAAGTGLAIGIAGLELWLLAEHNTVTPLMSSTLALAALAPWVWRIRAPERPIAESILAAEGAPFTQQRRSPEARTSPAPRPQLVPVPQSRTSTQAAEVARSSRLGIELPPDHVPGRGLPGVESVAPITTPAGNPPQPAVRVPSTQTTVAMPTQKSSRRPRHAPTARCWTLFNAT